VLWCTILRVTCANIAKRLAKSTKKFAVEKFFSPASLKNARLRCGRKQIEVAAECGISTAYLSELERGLKTNPNQALLANLAKAVRVEVADLRREPEGAAYPERRMNGRVMQIRDADHELRFDTATYQPAPRDFAGMLEAKLLDLAAESVQDIRTAPPGRLRMNAVMGALMYLREIQRRCIKAMRGFDEEGGPQE